MKKPIAQYPIDALVQRRLDALEKLVDTEYEGSAKVFEVRTGIKMAQVNQWFSGYRALRDKALRRLEEKTRKPEGYFDARPASGQSGPPIPSQRFDSLTPDEQRFVTNLRDIQADEDQWHELMELVAQKAARMRAIRERMMAQAKLPSPQPAARGLFCALNFRNCLQLAFAFAILCFTVNNTPMEQQMSNLHHPARLDGESFREYRQRRADSQKVVARALRGRLYFGPAKDQTRRALVKVHGRRQALRQIKHDRAEMKLERAIEEGEARGYVAYDERDDVYA